MSARGWTTWWRMLLFCLTVVLKVHRCFAVKPLIPVHTPDKLFWIYFPSGKNVQQAGQIHPWSFFAFFPYRSETFLMLFGWGWIFQSRFFDRIGTQQLSFFPSKSLDKFNQLWQVQGLAVGHYNRKLATHSGSQMRSVRMPLNITGRFQLSLPCPSLSVYLSTLVPSY